MISGGPLRRPNGAPKGVDFIFFIFTALLYKGIFQEEGLLKNQIYLPEGSKITVSLPHLNAFYGVLDVAPG